MKKEKAPASGAKKNATRANHSDDSAASQCARILEYLLVRLIMTTLEARQVLGIMNPSQRVSELRKRGCPIETRWVHQADESGAVHRVACYVWRGDQAKQMDFWGY